MPKALSVSEVIARAEAEVETAKTAIADTGARQSARTNRIRAALRRARMKLRLVLNYQTRLGRETTPEEYIKACRVRDTIQELWQ
jgi:hypothetical protein